MLLQLRLQSQTQKILSTQVKFLTCFSIIKKFGSHHIYHTLSHQGPQRVLKSGFIHNQGFHEYPFLVTNEYSPFWTYTNEYSRIFVISRIYSRTLEFRIFANIFANIREYSQISANIREYIREYWRIFTNIREYPLISSIAARS